MSVTLPKTTGQKIATVVVGVFVVLIIAAILFPVFAQHRGPRRSGIISNLKMIGLGLQMYAADFDDRLPDAGVWMDAIYPYTKNERILVDPTLKEPKPGEYGFAFFLPLSGIEIGTVADHDEVPLVFQSSDLRRNAAGDLSLLPKPPRANSKNFVGFLDTHVKPVPPEWPTEPVVVIIDQALKAKPKTE